MKFLKLASFGVMLFAMAFAGTAFAAGDTPRGMISAAQLKEMIADDSVRVIDVRPADQFTLGHIPGAINIPVADLEVAREDGIRMLAGAEDFAAVMSRSGISNDDFVVIYDEVGGSQASRVAWAMMHFGHFNVALLNGALAAWEGNTEDTARPVTPSVFTADCQHLMACIDDVKAALGNPEFVILDSRSPAEFSGETIMSGSGRGGHIPGAININWTANIDDYRVLHSVEELREMYAARGITPDRTIIVYCQGGIRASFPAFVLKQVLGFPNVLMYDGSWQEWSNHPDAP